MTYLSEEQRANLDALDAAHAELVRTRSAIDRELAEQKRQRLLALEKEESRLMNVARNSGVTKTAIARSVGTSNWATLEAKYALNPVAKVDIEIGYGDEFTIDRKASTFTLHWFDFNGEKIIEDATVPIDHTGLRNYGFGGAIGSAIKDALEFGDFSMIDRWNEAVRNG